MSFMKANSRKKKARTGRPRFSPGLVREGLSFFVSPVTTRFFAAECRATGKKRGVLLDGIVARIVAERKSVT